MTAKAGFCDRPANHETTEIVAVGETAAEWLQPLQTPPYAFVSYSLAQLRPTVFRLGGLDVLPSGEVLSPKREVIEGLYGAGRTVAGIPRTSKGYASGMSVADATYFGRLAGQQAAKQKRSA